MLPIKRHVTVKTQLAEMNDGSFLLKEVNQILAGKLTTSGVYFHFSSVTFKLPYHIQCQDPTA